MEGIGMDNKTGKRKGIDNLVPQSERTKEEQRRIAAMGGAASGETRRKRKTIREIYAYLLELPATDDMIADEAVKMVSKRNDDTPLTIYDAIALAQAVKAARGDTPAATYVRDSAGDKPIDKQDVTATVISDADRALLDKVSKRLDGKKE